MTRISSLLAVSFFLAALAASAAGPSKPSDPYGGLKKSQDEAEETVNDAKEKRLEDYQSLERLRKDVRYLSEELDREALDTEENKELKLYSAGGLARLDLARAKGGIDPRLGPALSRLETLYRELPDKEYAKDYGASLLRAVTDELRWAAEEAKDETELLALLDRDLALPDKMPTDADAFEALAFFPKNVPLDQFKRLGPIRIFLMKHRLRRPASYIATSSADILAGKRNVQIGVEVEGTVTGVYHAKDRDYTFDFGSLHLEITPEWRLAHPNMVKPKVGDRVRVKGWTYYDIFHKTELEFDAADPVLGFNRKSLWEVHPVQDVELLH